MSTTPEAPLYKARTTRLFPAPGGSSRPGRKGRLRLGQWLAVFGFLTVAVLASALLAGFVATTRINRAMDSLVAYTGQAAIGILQLEKALARQDAGVGQYALSGRPDLLKEYELGRADEVAAYAELERAVGFGPVRAREDLVSLRAQVAAWQNDVAQPALARVAAEGPGFEVDRAAFEAVSGTVNGYERQVISDREAGRAELARAERFLYACYAAIALAMLAALALTWAAVHRGIARPLALLSQSTRQVTLGAFDQRVEVTGPVEVVDLASDVDAMRRRIVEELTVVRHAENRLREQTEALNAQTAELNTQAEELRRSNADLEQFAYVASHDLQEPLRKVASFTQMLQRRYAGQLDDRADQYIAFAVDGARRMQTLINDLLAFSRVGRVTREHVVVDCDEIVRGAIDNLSTAIEESGAEVDVEDLPTLPADPLLLGQLFQNLIGNAIKFRTDKPPRVRIAATRDGDDWSFSCQDNGIGIDPQYADRIFLIFQRLHPKETYPGTGLGLALCKKIVEYHGGRIWLDDNTESGTTIRWTLPATVEAADAAVGAAPAAGSET